VDFSYSDEQLALGDAVRSVLSKAYADFAARRQTVAKEPGFDEALWRRLADLGVLGLPFAETDGGAGAGPVEVGIVSHELGRLLAPEPYLHAVVLAGGLVAAAGTEDQRAAVLGELVSGRQLLVFAHTEPGSRWRSSVAGVRAERRGGLWTLSGVKEPVHYGMSAHRLVVSAALPSGGAGLFLVDATAAALSRNGYRGVDGVPLARLAFAGTVAEPLGLAGTDATQMIEHVLDAGRIAVSNEAVGAMTFLLDTTSKYLNARKQFGVPLTTFQSLTFRAADMYVSLELAISTVAWATMVLASGSGEEIARAASRAGLQVSRAARRIGAEAIQMHGAVGMTAEYSVGSYTAHLVALDHLLGDAQFHLERLAAGVGSYSEADPLPSV
jgi:alkylation response protein AidB-like acyl-CoA dehydrogenase